MALNRRFVCKSSDLVEGGDGVRFELPSLDGDVPAFVIRFHGKAYGYLNRCGHVPVEIDWQPGKFFDHSGLYLICATHGAMYAPESGKCITGRCAGKGLEPLNISEQDKDVYILESGRRDG